MKTRRFFIVLIIMFFFVFSVYATQTTDTNQFFLHFVKPPRDSFFFSDPDSDVHAAFDSSKGLVFPIASEDKDLGYESVAYLGITFDIQSKATLKVYGNSKSTFDGTSTLLGKNTGNTLNYEVGFALYSGTAAESKKKALSACANITDVSKPFLTIYSHSGNSSGLNGRDLYQDAGTVIICFRVQSPLEGSEHRPYFADQYNGYVKMVFDVIV